MDLKGIQEMITQFGAEAVVNARDPDKEPWTPMSTPFRKYENNPFFRKSSLLLPQWRRACLESKFKSRVWYVLYHISLRLGYKLLDALRKIGEYLVRRDGWTERVMYCTTVCK